ncbi:MAG TPA: hypothetical protein VKB26_15350 [Candidatus Acidoferrales bacterium]|nr:hypothetical protein [Candidatus Acidoferrales bacterium]
MKATRENELAGINMKKLAAIDIVFLGPRFVVAEYAVGVLFPLALGIFILIRARSLSSFLLGAYFLSFGLNYAPLLAHAISIRTREKAVAQMKGELAETRKAMAKYRRVSLLLLVPFSVPLLELAQRRSRLKERAVL